MLESSKEIWCRDHQLAIFSVFETYGNGCQKERKGRILSVVALFCHCQLNENVVKSCCNIWKKHNGIRIHTVTISHAVVQVPAPSLTKCECVFFSRHWLLPVFTYVNLGSLFRFFSLKTLGLTGSNSCCWAENRHSKTRTTQSGTCSGRLQKCFKN